MSFVGMMDANFYDDLNRLGLRYGERMMNTLENVFHFQQARVENKRNQGVETSASSHVMEFYTPKTLRKVLEYVAIDYYLLNIPIPAWAERMLEQDAQDKRTLIIGCTNKLIGVIFYASDPSSVSTSLSSSRLSVLMRLWSFCMASN